MALFKSGTITQASGSVGGFTFSHNRGGLYIRARTVPVNPSTPSQNVVRTIMRLLVTRWTGVLVPGQRDAWTTYAENVPLVGPLGDPRNVGGLGMYIRSNVPRIQAGLPRVDAAPTIFDLGGFTPVTAGDPSAAAQELIVNFDNADEWTSEDGSAMLIFGARPKNPTVNYFTGPYRNTDRVSGDSTIPATTPGLSPSPFAFFPGQKIFYRMAITRADGRYSETQRLAAFAVV